MTFMWNCVWLEHFLSLGKYIVLTSVSPSSGSKCQSYLYFWRLPFPVFYSDNSNFQSFTFSRVFSTDVSNFLCIYFPGLSNVVISRNLFQQLEFSKFLIFAAFFDTSKTHQSQNWVSTAAKIEIEISFERNELRETLATFLLKLTY